MNNNIRKIVRECVNSVLNEDSDSDFSFNKEAKRVYKKIINNINNIKFKPTDEQDVVEDSRGIKHQLYGVKFSLGQINESGLEIFLVNRIGRYQPPYYDPNNNSIVFFIITQTQDKTSFEENSRLARLRFKDWVDEKIFVHEYTHYLDFNRYKNTYQSKDPKDDLEYYNSPEEYNAFFQEIVNNIIKNKTRLKKDDFDSFFKKSINYADKDFIKSLTDDNMKKLKVRLYKIYQNIQDDETILNKNSVLNEDSKNFDGSICPTIRITKEIENEVKKYNTSEELLRGGGISIEALDRAAYGFSSEDITELMPNNIKIKWHNDLESVKWEIKQSGITDFEYAKSVDLSEPIDVSYELRGSGLNFYLEDGHHRYYAAKILKKPLNVNLQIKYNPINKITRNKLGYDDFHRCIFNQVNQIK